MRKHCLVGMVLVLAVGAGTFSQDEATRKKDKRKKGKGNATAKSEREGQMKARALAAVRMAPAAVVSAAAGLPGAKTVMEQLLADVGEKERQVMDIRRKYFRELMDARKNGEDLKPIMDRAFAEAEPLMAQLVAARTQAAAGLVRLAQENPEATAKQMAQGLFGRWGKARRTRPKGDKAARPKRGSKGKRGDAIQ